MSANRTKKRSKAPRLVRLRYGTRYCELCRNAVRAGDLIGWWELDGRHTIYCATCQHSNVRAGRPLR